MRVAGRNPGLVGATVLAAAMGVGVSTAIFTVADAVLFQPLPGIDASDELFALYTDDVETPQVDYQGVSLPDVMEYGEEVAGIALAAFLRVPMTITDSSFPVRVVGDLVTADYFMVLGTAPAAGRLLAAQTDDGFSIVISHRLWRERFGERADAIGRTLVVNGFAFTIAGVAPRGFRGSLLDWYGDESIDLFVPIEMFDRWSPERDPLLITRTFASPQVVGRLEQGTTLEAARIALRLHSERLRNDYPDSNGSRELIVLRASNARFWPGRYLDNVRLLALVGAGSFLILLLVCGNLIGLWLPRIIVGRKELAIRVAVGGSRTAIAQSVTLEVLLLAAAIAAVGSGLAWGILQLVAAYPSPFGVALYRELELDTRSWLFAFGVAACAMTAIAVARLVGATYRRPIDALRAAPGDSGGRSSTRGRQIMIAVQIALSFVLLTTAGSLARSLQYLSQIDPGYDAEQVVVVPFEILGRTEDLANGRVFLDLLERIGRVPDVASASISNVGPLSRFRGTVDVSPTDESRSLSVSVVFRDVGPDYFETIGLRLLWGNTFRRGVTDSESVVINENLANRLWPAANAVGRFLRVAGEEGAPQRVIGVVGNAAHRDLRDVDEPYLYRPILKRTVTRGTILIRTRSIENRVTSSIRPVVGGMSNRIVVLDVRPLVHDVRAHLSRQYLAATVGITLSVVSIVLVIVGVFGLISTTAAQRRAEIGIRLAFGATWEHIALLLVRGAFLPSLAGIVAGSIAWWLWASPVLASEVYGIGSETPLIMASVAAGLMAVTLVAALQPACCAAGAEPLAVLRTD